MPGHNSEVRRTHRTNVHKLLGANIVGVHQERLVVLLEVGAQLGIILRRNGAARVSQPTAIWTDGHHRRGVQSATVAIDARPRNGPIFASLASTSRPAAKPRLSEPLSRQAAGELLTGLYTSHASRPASHLLLLGEPRRAGRHCGCEEGARSLGPSWAMGHSRRLDVLSLVKRPAISRLPGFVLRLGTGDNACEGVNLPSPSELLACTGSARKIDASATPCRPISRLPEIV